MGPILKNLRLEFCLIIGILLISVLIPGNGDGKNGEFVIKIFKDCDIGAIIGIIGMLWMVGATFRIYEELSHKVISFFLGLFVFIVGHSLHEYGLSTAFIFLGFVLLYVAYMSNPLIPSVAKVLFYTGLILLFFGYNFTGFNLPTDPEKYHQPVTYTDCKWDVNILYNDSEGKEQYKTIYKLNGTEEQAYKTAKPIFVQWKGTNKNCRLKEAQVNLIKESCPKEYRENYCYTHSLPIKYPKNRRLPWDNFDSLLDINN